MFTGTYFNILHSPLRSLNLSGVKSFPLRPEQENPIFKVQRTTSSTSSGSGICLNAGGRFISKFRMVLFFYLILRKHFTIFCIIYFKKKTVVISLLCFDRKSNLHWNLNKEVDVNLRAIYFKNHQIYFNVFNDSFISPGFHAWWVHFDYYLQELRSLTFFVLPSIKSSASFTQNSYTIKFFPIDFRIVWNGSSD